MKKGNHGLRAMSFESIEGSDSRKEGPFYTAMIFAVSGMAGLYRRARGDTKDARAFKAYYLDGLVTLIPFDALVAELAEAGITVNQPPTVPASKADESDVTATLTNDETVDAMREYNNGVTPGVAVDLSKTVANAKNVSDEGNKLAQEIRDHAKNKPAEKPPENKAAQTKPTDDESIDDLLPEPVKSTTPPVVPTAAAPPEPDDSRDLL